MQVFPIKAELLKPQDEMERHITDLIKKVFFWFYYFLLSMQFFLFPFESFWNYELSFDLVILLEDA